eukprot:Seg1259.3 transcript_id=Seg1259.3/GoldUCD/mRNA.D3Y31 product="Zinc finger protein 512B" protein_id=Seg1259.3/GoldUCD/D3Y31
MEVNYWNRVFLAFLVAQSLGHIYRLPCKKFAEFSIVEKDSGLNTDAIYNIPDNTNKNACRDVCIRNSECKSFSTNGAACELYTKTTEDSNDGVSLEYRPGWTYYSTYYGDTLAGPTCRRVNPCPGMQCTDICGYPGYHCQDIVYHPYVHVHVQYVTTQPAATTAQPEATTAKPVATTKPGTVTQSVAPTTKPAIVTKSVAPTTKPGTVTQSVAPTTKPGTVTKSVAPTTKPGTVTKSVAPTTKPGTVTQSVAPTTKPGTVTKSVAPTTKPGTVTKSVAPTTKPGTVTKSVAPTTKPGTVTKSVAPTTKPGTVTKSVAPTTKPGTVTKPVPPTTKPAIVTKSVAPTTKPATVTKPKGDCEDPCKYRFCAAYPHAICYRSQKDRCKPIFYIRGGFLQPNRRITDCGIKCVEKCPSTKKDVCGTNGQTYKNFCLLNVQKCRSKGKLGLHETKKCCKSRVKIVSQGQLSAKKIKGTGGRSTMRAGPGDGHKYTVSMPTLKRGYNILAVSEQSSPHWSASTKSFDTFEDDSAKVEMKKFIDRISENIVLVAIQEEGTRKASPDVYEALKEIHGTEPFQKEFRGAFAMIGYKGVTGARTPYWVQQVVQKDLRKDAVIEADVLLYCSMFEIS